MAAADIVICRAGAMTLTEIAKMGKAAIIIPSPNVVDNHQYKNAKVLSDEGAAVLICEYEMSEEGNCKICDAVDKIRLDADYRADMEKKIRGFAKDDVEKRIFDAIIELIESKKK
jgi:UDP-N-acetylglucosamine--N-acetylmuramyl-(pentapeptide) pyrophosphoryl-undecaprenol N-acetylglucosamine transferase